MHPLLIGFGILFAISTAIVLREMRRAVEVCPACGSPYCHGGTCIKRAAWDAEQREAADLAKIDAALGEPTDDLKPWRELLERL